MLVVCAYAGLDSSVLAAGWFKGSHQPLSKPLMLVAATPTQRVSRAAPRTCVGLVLPPRLSSGPGWTAEPVWECRDRPIPTTSASNDS